MTRALALLVGTVIVASCAAPHAPVPRPAVLEIGPPESLGPPAGMSALWQSYTGSAERLRLYELQSRCAPSGPVACFDPDRIGAAAVAKRRARIALGAAVLTPARARVAEFQRLVDNLPVATP